MNILSQLFPPKPTLTEQNLGDLSGKVFLVTGSNTGVGKELAQILYSKNAKVYVAARSEEKARTAIKNIEAAIPGSKGELVFLHLDLGDLSTIKASASRFLEQESKLDVLFNNAGVMTPPQGSKTAQGYELQLGTNDLGHFLFTQLVTPALLNAAKSAPANSVRVIWVSSSGAEYFTDRKNGGMPLDNLDYHVDKSAQYKYGVSKVGNYYHATEYQRRYGSQGILSVALNPGNLKSDLQRTAEWNGLQKILIEKFLLHPAVYGAYTELWAGLSPEVTAEKLNEGLWVVPWGRYLPIRKDIFKASKPESEGGTGVAAKFWEWSEEQVRQYA